MPKIVDREERRQLYVDALFRLIERGGSESISLRAIAVEAQTTKSTLSHYFADEAELFATAMKRVTASANRDVDAELALDLDLDHIVSATMRAIPGSESRRVESEIWLWMLRSATRNQGVAAVLHEFNADFESDVLRVLTMFDEAGRLESGLDLVAEARALHALVDGLSLRTMTDPMCLSREEIRQVVEVHLARIVTRS